MSIERTSSAATAICCPSHRRKKGRADGRRRAIGPQRKFSAVGACWGDGVVRAGHQNSDRVRIPPSPQTKAGFPLSPPFSLSFSIQPSPPATKRESTSVASLPQFVGEEEPRHTFRLLLLRLSALLHSPICAHSALPFPFRPSLTSSSKNRPPPSSSLPLRPSLFLLSSAPPPPCQATGLESCNRGGGGRKTGRRASERRKTHWWQSVCK